MISGNFMPKKLENFSERNAKNLTLKIPYR